jgi:NAD(P)-dependent dehydrogenase (short-subunit alcohol dehydrogenase family)
MGKLTGKVAIVTGGASGIGEYTVREMVKEGAKVVIADINDVLGGNLSEELNRSGKKTVYQRVDVSNEEEVEKMVIRAVNEFGKLDILFNNAGIGGGGLSHEIELEEWHKILAVNLDGVFLCAKHALIAMRKNGQGSIVNTASIMGHVGREHALAYISSKGAVVSMTRALALEYAKENIRVNAVCPGYILTPLLQSAGEEIVIQLADAQPMGRIGKPEEVAKAVVFLASDDASFITGTSLMVDGGYTAQ